MIGVDKAQVYIPPDNSVRMFQIIIASLPWLVNIDMQSNSIALPPTMYDRFLYFKRFSFKV